MEHTGPMDFFHGLNDGKEAVFGFLPGDGAGLPQPLGEGFPRRQVRDDVGGSVFLKSVCADGDLGDPAETAQLPGLLKKGLFFPVGVRLGGA